MQIIGNKLRMFQALKTDKSKLKLFEETVKQVFCTDIQFDSNLLKEKEKVETRYVNITA